MDEAYDRNQQRAQRLRLLAVAPPAAVLAVVAVVLGLLTTPLLGLALLVLTGAAVALWLRLLGPAPAAIALAATSARPVTEEEAPRLHNLVEGLCVGIGLPKPGLWVVQDDGVNALSVARSIDSAALVVTSALLSELTLVEQEAVLAHELARIRRGEAVVGCVATVCLGGTAALATPPGGRAQGTPPDGVGPAPAGTPPWGLVPVLWAAPLVRTLVARGAEPEDDGWTDLAAVDITRYPPALVAALAKAAQGDGAVAAAAPSIAHLWLVGPEPAGAVGEALAHVYAPRRPLADRIEMLEEL